MAASGCGKLKEGITAYHAMNYTKAIKVLDPIARKAAKKAPAFSLTVDAHTTIEDAAPHVTKDYFAAWQAYAGSRLGLDQIDQACQAIRTAMRPIIFKVSQKGKKKTKKTLNPMEGDFWQAEVFTLRAWWYATPCAPGEAKELEELGLQELMQIAVTPN